MDDAAIKEVGYASDAQKLALRLAALSRDSGLDGVVCSPQEIRAIKECCGGSFLAITPGVRPKDTSVDDQRRVATPAAAIGAGADFLVVGRPITRAPDPAGALESIYSELSASRGIEG
jgi:orotidine-5'-phosphate decarboxylase